MPWGGKIVQGKVFYRVTDNMGYLKGRYHPNPLVDTSEYRVEYPDGSSEEYAANLFAENCLPRLMARGENISYLMRL